MPNILRNRETLFALALILALAVLTVLGALSQTAEVQAVSLDSRSTAPDGARALFVWLEEIGYEVDDSVAAEYAIPSGTDLVFLLEPSGLTGVELDILADWVDAGGVLVFAGRLFGAAPLLAAFDVERGYADESADAIAPAFPLLTDPPVEDPVLFGASSFFEPGFTDYLPLAALPEGPIVIAFDQGEGRVVLSAATQPFTNAGLKLPGSGEFILNLVREGPADGRVWFDEWHHGRRPVVQGPAGPGDWLRRTAAGRALLYASAAVFVWIVFSGRSFGRPVSPANESSRRAPLEYITAIANLNQRAGNRADLLAHYHRRLKQNLAARYRLDPRLPDDEFIDHLGRYDPDAELTTLAELLSDLSKAGTGEPEIIRLAAQVADMLDSKK